MKITLCGSFRFIALFREAEKKLSLAGHVVYSMSVQETDAQRAMTPEEKETLDLIHFAKIAHSDAVMHICDATQYIGDSTRRELRFARIMEKSVYCWETDQGLRQFNRAVV